MAKEARWPKMMRCIVLCPQDSITGCKHIHSLCDELLMEILLRLPNSKSAFRSKCVCKRWDALISHPLFSLKFIRLKLENWEPENFGIVVWYESDKFRGLWSRHEFQGFFRPSIFQAQASTFSPLHSLGLGDDNALVVASCQDLLLYCRHEKDKYGYCISNAQTRECVVLPSPPSYCRMQSHLVGFICDPFYSSSRDIAINAAYHYSVVVCFSSRSSSANFRAHLFSSHCDSQWCDKVLSLPEDCLLYIPGPYRVFSSVRSSSASFSTNPSFKSLRHSVALPCRTKFSKIYALSSNDIKVGTNLEVNGAPWKVLEFLHVRKERLL